MQASRISSPTHKKGGWNPLPKPMPSNLNLKPPLEEDMNVLDYSPKKRVMIKGQREHHFRLSIELKTVRIDIHSNNDILVVEIDKG